jgi:hypothetical protein
MFNTVFCSHCGTLVNSSDFECSVCGKTRSIFTANALSFKYLYTPEYDRFDICEAYDLIEVDYNVSGILYERKSNDRRHMSTGYQLSRMQYKNPYGDYSHMSDNAKQIYHALQLKYGFLKSKVTKIEIDSVAGVIKVHRGNVDRTYKYSLNRFNFIMSKTFNKLPYSNKRNGVLVLTAKQQ